jgi:hypothetical protein
MKSKKRKGGRLKAWLVTGLLILTALSMILLDVLSTIQ